MARIAVWAERWLSRQGYPLDEELEALDDDDGLELIQSGWSCPSCGKPMRLRVVIEDGPTASRVLTSLCRAREPTAD